MKFFNSLKNKMKQIFKNKSDSTEAVEKETSKSKAEKTMPVQEKTVTDLPKYEWFLTEASKKEFEKYTSFTAYLEQDKEKKNYDTPVQMYQTYLWGVYKVRHNSMPTIPFVYFYSLLESLNSKYKSDLFTESLYGAVGIFKSVTINLLCDLAKRYDGIDENGEPIENSNHLDFEEIVSIENNPLLKFIVEFDAFSTKTIQEAANNGIEKLFFEGLNFIATLLMVKKDFKVLENNPWLLDKESYFTSFGTAKTKVGFYNCAISKTTGLYQALLKASLDNEKNNSGNKN